MLFFSIQGVVMSRVITFLGQAETAHTTVAIATARWFSRKGRRVLLVTHTPNPKAEALLGIPLTAQPQVVEPHLEVVQLQTTALLDQVWADLQSFVSLYWPLPALAEQVFPGELMLLPGFDSALAFNALRHYYTSAEYDIIVYDGRGDLETLRLLGLPNGADWYLQRFHKLFQAMDVAKVAESIGGPLASALVTANLDPKKFEQAMNILRNWIQQGLAVVNDPQNLSAYLITTDDPTAISETTWLWGSAQQVNLKINGVLVYQLHHNDLSTLQEAFSLLPISPLPKLQDHNWEPLIQALPDFLSLPSVPDPLSIDIAARQIRVFLPGFTKKQVKVTQFGNQFTVDAGDQRRNISLPPQLHNAPLLSGKFEPPFLFLSF
jgi:anion-transporting  ArsA/GET3 family ATPase